MHLSFFDIIPTSLGLEEQGKEFRPEVGLHMAPLSGVGGLIFALALLAFWVCLARKTSLSWKVYISFTIADVAIITGVTERHFQTRKRIAALLGRIKAFIRENRKGV